ncbi:MAG: acetyltransferase [Bacillota bacterium]|nr:MAG: acetyltransferase [Bacillota bacterium]
MIEVRPLRMEDRDEVVAISKQVWDDDYIGTVYDKWVADTAGLFVCVTYQGAIAGFAKVSMHTNDDAWLEGLRVDPHKRGLGLGKRLTRHCIEACLSLGIANTRLSTYIGNHESIGIIESHGFKRTAEFKALYLPIKQSEATPSFCSVMSDANKVEAALAQETLDRCKGYASFDFTFEKITSRLIEELAKEGAVHGVCVDGHVKGMMFASTRHSKGAALFLSYIQGPGHYAELIDTAIAHAERLGVNEVITMCPSDDMLREALVEKGFKAWDDHELNVFVYEYMHP